MAKPKSAYPSPLAREPLETDYDADVPTGGGWRSELLGAVKVTLRVTLGSAELTARELLDLKSGSVVKLGCTLADAVEVWLGDALIARGDVVAVDDNFGVRITQILERP